MAPPTTSPFADPSVKTQAIDTDPYETESIEVLQPKIEHSDDDDEEEIVEEIIEEVTDNEEEQSEEDEKPAEKPKVPGRVTPSSAVKNMRHGTPAKSAPTRSKLSGARNPFESPGKWTEGEFKQVSVIVPPLTSKNETTNDKTRATRPETRYWRANIKFSYGSFTSEQIRVTGVAIPYLNQRQYGSDEGYAYMCLPGFMGPHIAAAGMAMRPTTLKVGRLVSDNERYWVRANNIAGKFGILNKADNTFHKMNLETIFNGTGKGLIVNAILEFRVKASTDDMKPLNASVTQKVDVELIQAFIEEMKVDVQPPKVEATTDARKPAQVAATSEDYASDDVMKLLGDLGLV